MASMDYENDSGRYEGKLLYQDATRVYPHLVH